MLCLRTTAYEFGRYRIDPLARSLLRDEQLVSLPPKAIDVLVELVKKPGVVVGKDELMKTVWGNTFVEESNLTQMIFVLRRALGNTEENDLITTIPRRGFRFSAEVRTIELPCRLDSIAVLPLANLSGDASQEYFADGITEAVITELAKIGSLRVVSRTSVMRFRGTREPVAQIARALRVQAVVEGSIVRSGDRMRITVQLIHAATDQHLWAHSYEDAITNVLGVQRRVASDVADTLRADLTVDEKFRLTNRRTVNSDAYSLYLKGRFFARQLTEEGQRKAIQCFQASLQIDGNYAAAYAGVAECFIELAYFFGMEPKKAFAEAKPAAEKAVSLDPELADGHAVLGLLRLLHDWDWAGADAASARGVELAPGDPYVYWKRGVFLRYAGRGEEAVAAHRKAESLDPFSLIAMEELGWPLYYSRRFTESIEQFRKVVELEPNWDQLYFGLGLALVQQEEFDSSIVALRRASELDPSNPFNQAALIYALGRAGFMQEANEAFERLSAKYEYVPRWFLSIIWVGLDDNERALEALEQAFAGREPCLVSLKVEPIFDPLRSDQRFSAMIRRVGLAT